MGAGAMGSLFGGLLAADGHEVTLATTREDHVAAIRREGLVIETMDGDERRVDVPAATDPGDLEPPDLVVVFVKSHDTEEAVRDAVPLLGEGTDVLTLQNGLGNAETIADHVPEERVVAGTTAQGAILESPGRVVHTGAGPTTVGRYFRENDERVAEVATHLTAAGIDTEVTDAVRDEVWRKVLVNLGINAATALAGVRNGLVTETEPGRSLAEAAVAEGAEVARREGREVGDDVVEYTLEVARATADNRSSMRQDLAAGRRTEIEALNGAVVERAERHGVDVPVNRTLADLVRLAERGFADG